MATMVQAIRMALHVGESRLGVKDIFGQDVGAPLGGVFTATQGLKTAWNTPLDERGIVGAARRGDGDRAVRAFDLAWCDRWAARRLRGETRGRVAGAGRVHSTARSAAGDCLLRHSGDRFDLLPGLRCSEGRVRR